MPNPKWFQQAKPTCSIVPLRRFVTDSVFALKNGGYGCMFALNGIDDEGLTDEVVEDAIRRVHGALKACPRMAGCINTCEFEKASTYRARSTTRTRASRLL